MLVRQGEIRETMVSMSIVVLPLLILAAKIVMRERERSGRRTVLPNTLLPRRVQPLADISRHAATD